MIQTECNDQLELFEVGRQQVTMTFDGGHVVCDAGLLPLRELDCKLGILDEAARRLADPRAQMFVTHSAERILTQQVYQILAGYPDGNDAQLLRNDPLFKLLVHVLAYLLYVLFRETNAHRSGIAAGHAEIRPPPRRSIARCAMQVSVARAHLQKLTIFPPRDILR